MSHKVMTLDLETTGLNPWKDKILLIAYRFDGLGRVHQIKVYDGEQPGREFLLNLADSTVTKRGHNVHFDLLCLIAAGYTVKGPLDDTRILAYLENPAQELGLKILVETKLKRKVVRLEELGPNRLTKALKGQARIVKSGNTYILDRNKFEEYNTTDVINADDLRHELVTSKWYKEVEQPLSQILFETEARGIYLDIPYFESLKHEFQEACEKSKKSFNDGNFNPNSPAQVKAKFKEKGVYLDTTNKHQLKQLSWSGNEFAKQLLGYRGLSKILSTYIEPFIERAVESRLHGSFNQAGRESSSIGDIKGTATGRLSSSNPNLQNIPDRTQEGKKIRRGIIATPGMILIDSDLKQIEPRLIAHYTQSPKLIDAFTAEKDTHAIMGAGIFNKQPENLTKLERFIGKTSWLATVYGCWFKKLRKIVEVNSDEPIAYDDDFYKKIQESFWRANPEILFWRERHISATKSCGYIETIGGRHIQIPGINSHNEWERKEAERFAVNYLIQGSAADIMKMILVELYKQASSVDLLATVHDEVLMETKNPLMKNLVDDIMCNTIKLNNVKLEADTKIIQNWSEK